jgi:hypothetical protein
MLTKYKPVQLVPSPGPQADYIAVMQRYLSLKRNGLEVCVRQAISSEKGYYTNNVGPIEGELYTATFYIYRSKKVPKGDGFFVDLKADQNIKDEIQKGVNEKINETFILNKRIRLEASENGPYHYIARVPRLFGIQSKTLIITIDSSRADGIKFIVEELRQSKGVLVHSIKVREKYRTRPKTGQSEREAIEDAINRIYNNNLLKKALLRTEN